MYSSVLIENSRHFLVWSTLNIQAPKFLRTFIINEFHGYLSDEGGCPIRRRRFLNDRAHGRAQSK